MMSLVEFLLARISEDEAAAREVAHYVGPYEVIDILVSRTEDGVTTSKRLNPYHPVRALAECQAKRAIIALYVHAVARLDDPGPVDPDAVEVVEARDQGAEAALEDALLALAAPYADHPAFDPSWGVPEQNKEQR